MDPVGRMRFKLERWSLSGLPGNSARRLVRALGQLRRLVRARAAQSGPEDLDDDDLGDLGLAPPEAARLLAYFALGRREL